MLQLPAANQGRIIGDDICGGGELRCFLQLLGPCSAAAIYVVPLQLHGACSAAATFSCSPRYSGPARRRRHPLFSPFLGTRSAAATSAVFPAPPDLLSGGDIPLFSPLLGACLEAVRSAVSPTPRSQLGSEPYS